MNCRAKEKAGLKNPAFLIHPQQLPSILKNGSRISSNSETNLKHYSRVINYIVNISKRISFDLNFLTSTESAGKKNKKTGEGK